MKYFMLISAMFLFQLVLLGQDSLGISTPHKHSKTFIAKVWDSGNMEMKAYLVQVNDSMIFFSTRPIPLNSVNNKERLEPMHYSAIERIEIKRTKAVGRGILRGFLGGAFVGVLIGLASGDDPPDQWFAWSATEKAAAYGLGLGVSAGIIGAIVGLVAKKTFIIGGNRASLQEMNRELFASVYR